MSATLVVLPRFPNDRTGTGQRSRLLLEGALAAGPVHVVVLAETAQIPSQEALPGVASIAMLSSERITPRNVLARRIGGGLRLLVPGWAYAPDPDLRRALLELIRRHGIDRTIFRYTSLFCAAGITPADGVRVLVDVDDRDDQKYQTRLLRLLGPRMAGTWLGQMPLIRLSRLLKARLSQASHVWFATEEDIWPLEAAQVSLLPNVVYGPAPASIRPPSDCPPTLLFVGIFNHLPNRDGIVWFLQNCWADVLALCPEARLRIVGRGNWASLEDRFPDIANVAFVGEVAELSPEYDGARLAICPVREGGGSKIKVIEAASYARPVVATSHSLRGFDNLIRDAVESADTPKAFAEACALMLTEPSRADQQGRALQDWQRAHYSRDAFVNKVSQTLGV